jgi:hypothetical protein
LHVFEKKHKFCNRSNHRKIKTKFKKGVSNYMATIPVEGAVSIRNLIANAGLTLSPSAQFVVDGTFVGIDHEVAPGGHVSVSVPLKAG